MRLWSLHPRYLDSYGLVAVWREALLAQAVLLGETKGYKSHPQLRRFYAVCDPISAISRYLVGIHAEAISRGYVFDATKIYRSTEECSILVTTGQIVYEWQHLMLKLHKRSPKIYQRNKTVLDIKLHAMFIETHGSIEDWEKLSMKE